MTELSPTEVTRAKLGAWVETSTASWNALWFITLNFRLTAPNDAGGVVRLTEAIACREIVDYGKRVDRAVHGRLVQRLKVGHNLLEIFESLCT